MLEREWKFLVSREEFESKRKALNFSVLREIGIIQWYLNDHDTEEVERRIRLEIVKQPTGLLSRWILTEKRETGEPGSRFEFEKFIEPDEETLKKLQNSKMIAKIRYVLSSDPEIVVDEFLNPGDLHYSFDNESTLVAEVEERATSLDVDDAVESLKKLGFEGARLLQGAEADAFKNRKLAAETKLPIHKIIEFVRNRLLGEVYLVMAIGTSIMRNISNDEEKSKKVNEEKSKEVNVEDVKEYLIQLFRSFQSSLNLGQVLESNKSSNKLPAELDMIRLMVSKGFKISKFFGITNQPFVNCNDDSGLDKKNKAILAALRELASSDEFKGTLDRYNFLQERDAPLQFHMLKFVLSLAGFELVNKPISFDPNKFLNASLVLRNVWEHLDEISNLAEGEGKEIILEVTSGLKPMSTAIQLWALFNQKDSFYKFESSPSLARIPAIGIDWDLNYVDEIASLLSAIEGESAQLNIVDYLKLPFEIARFFNGEKVANGSDDFRFVCFYDIKGVQGKYLEKREMPFGYGEGLINAIGNGNPKQKALRSYLENGIIRKWSYLWLGDLIPETVEHSQRHSKRLMDFTKTLLNIMGEDYFLKPFSEDELGKEFVDGITYRDLLYFLLIVAMNVHDLGHVYPKFTTPSGCVFHLDGIPSAIRDLHSETVVQLIEDKNYDVLAFEKAFRDNVQSLVSIFGREKATVVKEAVKLICRYHRGYTSVDNPITEIKDFMKIFEIETRSAREVVEERIQDALLRRIVIFLIRWLKFIDGTDVQADRVVTESYHKNRVLRTRNESLHLIERLEALNGHDVGDEQVREAKRRIFEEVKPVLEKFEPLSQPDNVEFAELLDNISKDLENIVYNLLGKIKESCGNGYVRIPYEVQLIDMVAFKVRQFKHFEKHRTVAAVFPSFFQFNNADRKAMLHVSLVENRKTGTYEEHSPEYQVIAKVSEEIKKEFDNAKLVLEYHPRVFSHFDIKLSVFA